MRSPLARATACPECGRPVCGVLRRTFAFLRNREKTNCPYCGCPCYTPLPLYGVMLAVGAACAYPVWRIGGGWGQIVEFFLLGYVLAGVPLMELVPFRARGAFGPFSRWSGSSAPSTTGPTTSGTPPGTCCGGQRRTTRFCRQTASAWSFPSSERPAATGWPAAFGCRWSRRRAGGAGWWCAQPGDMTRRT